MGKFIQLILLTVLFVTMECQLTPCEECQVEFSDCLKTNLAWNCQVARRECLMEGSCAEVHEDDEEGMEEKVEDEVEVSSTTASIISKISTVGIKPTITYVSTTTTTLATTTQTNAWDNWFHSIPITRRGAIIGMTVATITALFFGFFVAKVAGRLIYTNREAILEPFVLIWRRIRRNARRRRRNDQERLNAEIERGGENAANPGQAMGMVDIPLR